MKGRYRMFWLGGAAVLFFVAGVYAPLSFSADPALPGWWPASIFGFMGVLYLLIFEFLQGLWAATNRREHEQDTRTRQRT